MLTFHFSGAAGKTSGSDVLTAGMVGRQIHVEFSEDWESLVKTVVFSNGEQTRDVVFTGNPVTIPAEVLETPLRTLTVGAVGLGEGGSVVIPTIRVQGPVVQPSVEPSGDASTDPELPIWQQILAMIGDLDDLWTFNRENLVEAINEAVTKASSGGGGSGTKVYFTPHVSEDGVLSWTNNGGAPNPLPVNVRGPAGADGKNGKDGRTPIRGKDYWTEEDKAEIRQYVEDAILGGAW